MRKIWLLCLCLASLSLSLVGCFHVPDEDWLPSKNSINTWNIENENEMKHAMDDLLDWVNMISNEWNQLNKDDVVYEEWTSDSIETTDDTTDEVSNTGEIFNGLNEENRYEEGLM